MIHKKTLFLLLLSLFLSACSSSPTQCVQGSVELLVQERPVVKTKDLPDSASDQEFVASLFEDLKNCQAWGMRYEKYNKGMNKQ